MGRGAHRLRSTPAKRVSGAHRRIVRVAREVFDRLDEILGSERGLDGQPSANDFLTFELVAIIETFATEFESLPRLFDQRADYRILINRGTIVDAYSVIGQQAPDQSIDLLRVDIDFGA